jgi:hypothetical protein
MDIYLAAEHAYQLTPQLSVDVARDRIEQKKLAFVVGTVGSLFSHPKADEIQLVASESRLEPYWLVVASSRTSYDRSASYIVPVGGTDVQQVTVLGQTLSSISHDKSGSSFTLAAVEHCVQELRTRQTFDGITGMKVDVQKYVAATKVEIPEMATFAPSGMLVIPPQIRATAVVRQVIAEVVRPVQNAQIIHEELVNIETVDLHFRPVYAFEYVWAAKNKRVVIECDAIAGDIRTGGKTWGDQFKGIITGDFMFDITADAAGLLVPGGSIAVKFVKAVVDRSK